MRDLTKAIISLYPGSEWVLNGETYDGLEWMSSNSKPKPTQKELEDECDRLHQIWVNEQYKRDRAKEYPDFKDYLDGIVKGDQAQIQAYIDACLAVKAKYPKP